MTSRLRILVYENQQLRYVDDFEGTLEIGRQKDREHEPISRYPEAGGWRLVIAGREDKSVGRTHAQIVPLPDGRARIRNGSSGQPVWFQNGQKLAPRDSCEVRLPSVLTLGEKTICVQEGAAESSIQSLPHATLPPSSQFVRSGGLSSLLAPAATAIDSKEIVQWLHAAMDVLQAAADSADFFERAEQAAMEMVRLDLCEVLLFRNGEWRRHAPGAGEEADLPKKHRASSLYVLKRVEEEKRTFWGSLPTDGTAPHGPAETEAVIATPILDRAGQLLGAMYAERRHGGEEPIKEVEAMLVELLARGVAAGLARLEQERAAMAERVRFEQFFTPELAQQLSRHPDLLQGREAQVTLLFCDIRGFSRISERLGPARTVEWFREVLDMLSDCVLSRGGVLVDYNGDGLLAMWGAPGAQPDHARRACRAGLAMLEGMRPINERWRETLREDAHLGIGVNTGPAQVGNTGSRYKFKYGPRGHTVNLASRVEGATKHLKCPLLITGSTKAQLDETFATRRLGRVRVVNITADVELHELTADGRPEWPEARAEYEKALELFEKEEFGQSARTLGNWRGRNNDDAPALVLLFRAVRCMVEGTPPAHPVWELAEK
jgi:adenylate cyclase